MNKFKKIIDSFLLKDSLNPKVWENPEDPKKAKMKPKVKNALEKISEEFIDYLGDDVFVQDIILTGSLSNFNWSEFSDFDLHIIIDFNEYGKNKDLYKELYDLKKFVFNTNHDIKIFGYDVELYAQDEEESHYASGVYSIMNDEWITIPKKEKFDLDKKILENKVKSWVEKINKSIETATSKDDKEILEKVKDKLKEYRKTGLEKDGELSYENLVFKFLRRSGHIEKLFDMKNKVKDKELSVETKINEDFSSTLSPQEIMNNSSFLKSIFELNKNNFSAEYTPNQKIPYEPEVEKIQTGLQLLNYPLARWGVDGKFGPETQQATKDFQKDVNLDVTGIFGPKEAVYLVGKLIVDGFKESDLSGVKKKKDYTFKTSSIKSSLNFEDNIRTIIDTLEGGYYHPNMKIQNPDKFAVMGDSGETMFGIDRKHGASLELNTPEGKEFWRLIDSQNAKDNWNYEYTLDDNQNLKNELIKLSAKIFEGVFYDFSERFLSNEAKEIVMSDPKLFFHFLYAGYNGSGWFQKFAKVINQKIEEGITDLDALRTIAISSRKQSSNPLIKRSGEKMEEIFQLMA